jgi:hypothetical protein
MMAEDYNSLMTLWKDLEAGVEDHPCSTGDCMSCETCDRSWEARGLLYGSLGDVMKLLGRYHDILADLADQVIQEVPLPRNEKLQMAMLKAVSILDKDGSSNGANSR